MRKNKFTLVSLICTMLVTLLSACSGSGSETAGTTGSPTPTPIATEKPRDPIELKIHAGGVSEDEFNKRFKDVLTKKFPYIKLVWLPTAGAGNSMQDYVARGEIPDIIRNISSTIQTNYFNLGLEYDMRELIKKYNYDLNRFNQVYIKGFQDLTATNGEIYGLPVSPFFSRVLYYNKDLFDKFGVPYLKDGMNWDEIYDIAKKMSRVEDGVNYRGFAANVATFFTYNEYSLSTLDPSKDELSSFDTWKKIFDNYIRFYQIPNNAIAPTIPEEGALFQKGTVAMHADIYSPYLDLSMLKNWDMVSIPIIEGAPKKIGTFPPGYLLITKQSKYKEDAFKVIMEMLSDDVQMTDAKNGFLPTVANKEMMNVLGQNAPAYKGKNMKAVGYYEFAPLRPGRAKGMTVVETNVADTLLRTNFLEAAQGKTDSNTALRKTDEQLKAEVAKIKAATK
ncbi:ABC transporter substrate-binding protein [Paenibacillus sp. HJGM_3]|uniref:ABC transporter substrate-binding protein n=1 Tax=Paenibacillus sp. HJGM_3 TaxID=3379816 RepID=UPI00385C215F